MLVGQRIHAGVTSLTSSKSNNFKSKSQTELDSKLMRDDKQEEALLAVIDEANGCYAPILLNNKCEDNTLWERPLGYGAFGVVWSVFDPRTRKKAALKRIPNIFHNTVTAKRLYRELFILSHIKHENIISLVDIVKSDHSFINDEIYILCDFMQTDLHKIIVSPQALSVDHVKIFLYQILRGVKYLHSAHIIHRDIKPGNMLVNSNCLLKICDFGLARIEDKRNISPLTQEVVTQYYRAPELLMESSYYAFAVDMWSIGCTFAELLCRRILFQAKGPLEQLDLILNIVGTPPLTDLCHAHPDARYYVLSKRKKKPNLGMIAKWSNNVTEEALRLLDSMLKFNPDHRISSEEALSHSYLDDARLRYHSCMCSCCHDHQDSSKPNDGIVRNFCIDSEPICPKPISSTIDNSFTKMSEAKETIKKFIKNYYQKDQYRLRLVLNPNSKNYQPLLTSSVAQAKEDPTNHKW
uniref:Mitogen-activated protein kinase n=1 Tax=Schmidtea mediterranea TaxID=79327 RepID=H9CXV4_SCHMD|nr:NLK-1 [Schmidtea mediterranea]